MFDRLLLALYLDVPGGYTNIETIHEHGRESGARTIDLTKKLNQFDGIWGQQQTLRHRALCRIH